MVGLLVFLKSDGQAQRRMSWGRRLCPGWISAGPGTSLVVSNPSAVDELHIGLSIGSWPRCALSPCSGSFFVSNY